MTSKNNISFQQKEVLKRINDGKGHLPGEFSKLFSGTALYISLDCLCEKELIKKVGKQYFITKEGKDYLFWENLF